MVPRNAVLDSQSMQLVLVCIIQRIDIVCIYTHANTSKIKNKIVTGRIDIVGIEGDLGVA
jgi:hypothetical protein